MKLQYFHVEAADWSRQAQRDALLALRHEVFVQEQGVPEELERDDLDAHCHHVLARDDRGQPIGCGRLTPQHKIGRMAVRQSWRGHGVGAAMLRELVEKARALGWPEVSLGAQLPAIGFYERQGFCAYGEVFDDAGIAHRAMRLSLSPAERVETPPRERETLPATTRADLASARLQLLRDARHRVELYAPLLPVDSYASDDELEQWRRLATSGRNAHIRIVLHDPAAALRDDHRLIALAQRLPSALHIRTPLEDADLSYGSSYLLNDVGGYLLLPDATRLPGRAARHDRAAQAPLRQHFDHAWDRSTPASVLQRLDM
jgi:predicted GNAT family N-acyltransferase